MERYKLDGNIKPELLAPAGDWASLHSAISAGADAVYFGVKGRNMRSSAGNFDIFEIGKVMRLLHTNGKKGYLALNVIVYDDEIQSVRKVLEEAVSSGVDAVILWDMAVLSMAKELGMEIHLSTQASVANMEAVRYYSSIGVKRIVLARECTLDSIKSMIGCMRREKIDCGIEAFIHGAMCVSISGRCFLSQYSFGKSANRGECLQPCRREYSIIDTSPEQKGECGYVVGKDYVLSPRDLCTVMFIDRMIAAGITSFKIEGRMRSPEYVKVVSSVYREAIDAYFSGDLTDELKTQLFGRLEQSFNRGFSGGFYMGKPDDLGASPARDYKKTYVGEVVKYYRKIGVAEVRITCRDIEKGQELLITGKTTPAFFMQALEMEIEHRSVEAVPQGQSAGIKVPFVVKPKDKVFIWEKVD